MQTLVAAQSVLEDQSGCALGALNSWSDALSNAYSEPYPKGIVKNHETGSALLT